MKSTLDQLTKNEQDALARLYDSESYKVLKKLMDAERLNIATKLLDINPTDTIYIAQQQGRAANFKELNLVLKNNAKKV